MERRPGNKEERFRESPERRVRGKEASASYLGGHPRVVRKEEAHKKDLGVARVRIDPLIAVPRTSYRPRNPEKECW